MGKLNIYPERVFEIFEEICSIPHGSYNTGALSSWLLDFAKARGIEAVRDAAGNVVMKKPASAGRESAQPVILQGHIDMVCEKDSSCALDMDRQGVEPYIDGEYVRARGTTLGADNGIAVAYALAVLESDTIPHPPLEAVFTADEEVGMLGAVALDMSGLRGRRLINIDTGEEGKLTVGCAGGAAIRCVFPIKRRAIERTEVKLSVAGCAGGHSGSMIVNGGANADIVLARLLAALSEDAEIVSVSGGGKDNAIPREAQAVVAAEDVAPVLRITEAIDAEIRSEFAGTDPDIAVRAEPGGLRELEIIDAPYADRIVAFLTSAPNGLQSLIPGTRNAQTSLNLGILVTGEDSVAATYLLRSCVGSEKEALRGRLEELCGRFGGEPELLSSYPEWEFDPDSALRGVMTEIYTDLFGREPEVEVIHGGLECGLFSKKLPGLDIVACGPDILGAHTPLERLDIASAGRVWEYLLKILEKL